MTDLPDSLPNSSNHPAKLAAALLHHYSFELAGYSLVQQIEIWLEYYPARWLPLAIIEALYQGRYKAISVEQILNLWERRDQPVYHFNHEFERLICGSLPQPTPVESPDSTRSRPLSAAPGVSYRKLLLELPSIQASRLERLSEIPSLKLAFKRSDPYSGPPADANAGASAQAKTAPNPAVEAPLTRESPTVSANGADTLDADFEHNRDFQAFQAGVVFGLSSGLAVTALKPKFRLLFSQYYQPNWMSFLEAPTAIAPLVPESNGLL